MDPILRKTVKHLRAFSVWNFTGIDFPAAAVLWHHGNFSRDFYRSDFASSRFLAFFELIYSESHELNKSGEK